MISYSSRRIYRMAYILAGKENAERSIERRKTA